MKVRAALATYPGHHHLVRRTVESLLPQVDRVYVCNSDQVCPPLRGDWTAPWLGRLWMVDVFGGPALGADFGDAGKFYFCGASMFSPKTDVWLICDDDLVYPPDYAKKMVEAIERYDRKAAVSFHGALMIPPVRTYRGSRQQFSCLLEQKHDVPAHVLGTGTLGFHSSLFDPPLTMADFPVKNMADLWFAKVLQERRIPAVVAAHREGWIKSTLGPDDPSLWKAGELPETTELVRSIDWQLHR